jgi:UDP-2-acetamido-3-amino-2,3-dideoxy-glucuronate N-acetyltransferase
MAVFDDTAEKKLLLYPHRVDWASRTPKAVKADAVAVELEKAEPLAAECRHFLDCVASRRPPLSDGNEGLRVLKVLGACQQSLESGAALSVPSAASVTVPDAAREYFAHESAYIDEPCTIGKGTKIWHFSHVMKGAKIGQNCSIGQNVVIGSAAVIGNGVKIQNNVSVYDTVTIEDGVFCGPSMVFTNVINPRSEIVRKNEYRPTLIRHGATLGANSTIVCGHTIGRYAFVAAGAVVASNVPDFALMAGVPARRIGWMCRCAGARLQFDAGGSAACGACGAKFRLAGDHVSEV